jgi:DNA-directed RNA polymerase subunit K/omega
MKKKPDPYTPTQEEIAARARQLSQQAGQPADQDGKFRGGAEAELRKDRKVTVETARKNPDGDRRAGEIAPPS